LAPTKFGAQNLPIFDDFATQWQFEGQCLRRGTRYRQSGNGIENYERFPVLSQIFMNFDPLTAKNKMGAFTHPPKILRFFSLPGFTHALQTTELNQTLSHGRGKPL